MGGRGGSRVHSGHRPSRIAIAPSTEMEEYTNEWKNSVFSFNASICCEAFTCYYCFHGYIYNELAFFGGETGDLEPAFCNDHCIAPAILNFLVCLGVAKTIEARLAVRTRYKIKEDSCRGCCTQWLLPCCAAAQLALELNHHGDWNGSMCSSKSSQPRETTKENAPLTEQQRMMQQMMKMQQEAQQQAQQQQAQLIAQQLYHLQQQGGPPQEGISTAGQQPGMMMNQPQPAQPGFVVDPYQQQQAQQPVSAFATSGFAPPPPPLQAMN